MYPPSNRPSTQTGVVPRYDAGSGEANEPPLPLTLPEMDEPHGTTGVIQIVNEGQDDSRDLAELDEP